jgi:hypothetical protein
MKKYFLKGSFRCKCEVMCNYEQQPESKQCSNKCMGEHCVRPVKKIVCESMPEDECNIFKYIRIFVDDHPQK